MKVKRAHSCFHVVSGLVLPRVAALLLLTGAPAAGQATISGTVHAPPGEDVQGAVVVACYAENGRCAYGSPHRNSRAIQVEARGGSARFAVHGLVPGEYVILGTRDMNGNGVEDAGDWVAQETGLRTVRPPAAGIELRFTRMGAQARAASPARPRPPGNPAAVPRAPGSGGLSGIYQGVKRQVVAPGLGSGVASGITWTPQRDWTTFFPDGRVYLAMPEQGLAVPFDWEGECATSPAWCATYTVRGSEVRIRWLTGEEKVLRRDPDGTLWTSDRINYDRHDPLNGRRLEGRYEIPWKKPHLTVSIEFTRDGRFREQNLLGNIGWMILKGGRDPAVAALLAVKQGAGTYSLRDNTLELRYSDGRIARITTYILPQELRKAVPDEIYIHAHDFRRVR